MRPMKGVAMRCLWIALLIAFCGSMALADGDKAWDRRFGGTRDDMGYSSVALAGGGAVLVGLLGEKPWNAADIQPPSATGATSILLLDD